MQTTPAYRITSIEPAEPVEVRARAQAVYVNGKEVVASVTMALAVDEKTCYAIVQDEDFNLYLIDTELFERACNAAERAARPGSALDMYQRRQQAAPNLPQVTVTFDNRTQQVSVNGERPGAEEFYVNDVIRLMFYGRPSICIRTEDYRKLRPAAKGRRKPISMTFETVPFPTGERSTGAMISDSRIHSDILTGEIAEPPA